MSNKGRQARPANAASGGRRGAFGIRLKLQAAFAAVAIMTLVAVAVGIVSFSATERGVERVTGSEVPLMTDALRLSATSGEVSAAAARYVGARGVDEHKEIAGSIAERSRALADMVARLRARSQGDPIFAAVEAKSARLAANLEALEPVIAERSALHARLTVQIDAVHKLHTTIGDKLTPIVDDSYFEVVSSAESVGKNAEKTVKSLVGGMQVMQAVIEIGAQVNLITGLMTSSALTGSPAILSLLEDRFTAATRRAAQLLGKLPADERYAPIKARLEALTRLADFAAGTATQDAARLQAIFRAHEALNNLLVGLIDDLNFDLVMRSGDAVQKSGRTVKLLVSNQVAGLRNALDIAAQTHLITTLMSEGATARDAAMLVPIEDRFKAAVDHIGKVARGVDKDIAAAVASLIALGQGDGSVFALRARELAAAERASQAVAENVAIQRDLDAAVTALVAKAETAMQGGTEDLIGSLARSRMLLIAVAVASLVAAGGIGVFYVQRRLIRRLTRMGEAMRALSAGDTERAVPATADRDEIGDMARSLEVFRAAEIERRDFATRRESEQAAQQARAAAIEAMIDEFRAAMRAAIDTVTANAGRMETTARGLSEISARADGQARAAASSSEQTSANVRSVAAAAEELGGSVQQISGQAAKANEVVEQATGIAGNADRLVGRLSEGAERIGDVIKLIRDIAEQTNLLALNATIEAARAGEAGRGFAVVAAEVKTLAGQTAKATEEIAAQIGAIQGSTGEAVDAIRAIGEAVGGISAFTSTIATAVEEQSASTGEIVRSSQEAADGSRELAGAMAGMTSTVVETRDSAGAVLGAAQVLTAEAATLRETVDVFLRRVKAA